MGDGDKGHSPGTDEYSNSCLCSKDILMKTGGELLLSYSLPEGGIGACRCWRIIYVVLRRVDVLSNTTLLFLCPDNALLGPLAEAYLNSKANGLIRAFSAAPAPSGRLSRHVERLLAAEGLDARGLTPKPVDIFLLPYAVVPDRVIYLADLAPIDQPSHWKATTSSHWWSIAGKPPLAEGFTASAGYFLKIRTVIDRLLVPPGISALPVVRDVA